MSPTPLKHDKVKISNWVSVIVSINTVGPPYAASRESPKNPQRRAGYRFTEIIKDPVFS